MSRSDRLCHRDNRDASNDTGNAARGARRRNERQESGIADEGNEPT